MLRALLQETHEVQKWKKCPLAAVSECAQWILWQSAQQILLSFLHVDTLA